MWVSPACLLHTLLAKRSPAVMPPRLKVYGVGHITALTYVLNPPVQQWGKSLPPHLCSLTAPDENTPPQPVDTSLEDAQLSRVAGHGVVLVITQHNRSKPCTDRGRTIMLRR